MVHGVVTLRLVVPLEQREVHHPQRGELLRVAQPQLLGHFEAQGAQLRQRLELLAAEDEDHVPGHSAAALGHGKGDEPPFVFHAADKEPRGPRQAQHRLSERQLVFRRL